MSLTGKTLAATYHSLLKLSTTDNQNFDGTLRNIVDGEDVASNLSLTDPSTGKSILSVDGSHANGTAIQIDNSATDGDCMLEYQLSGTTTWVMGLEDGDSDALKICHDSTLGSDERLTFKAATTVFNEDGSDIDFRVESNSSAYMIVGDASTNNVGIGIATPLSALSVYMNNSTAGATSGIAIEQDGTGDAVLYFDLTGAFDWTLGVDNNQSNKFCLSSGSDFGSTGSGGSCLQIDTSRNVTFGKALADDHSASYDFEVVNAGQNDISIVSTNNTANIRLDAGSDSHNSGIVMSRGGSTKGQIYYDHNATATSEVMRFYVNNNTTSALQLKGDAKGANNAIGAAPNGAAALEVTGDPSDSRSCLALYDDGTGTKHATGSMFMNPIIPDGSLSANGGYMEFHINGGSFMFFGGGQNGGSCMAVGYMGGSYVSSGTKLAENEFTIQWDSGTVGSSQKIRVTNTDSANAQVFYGWICSSSSEVQITART